MFLRNVSIIYVLASLIALLVLLPTHEFAHAFVAVKCGDNTPKMYKRLTLNPLAHLDPFGFASLILVGFGWAKPVPVNPYNFKRYKLDSILVSLAGVTVNILTAFFAYPLFVLFLRLSMDSYWCQFFATVFYLIYAYGISLFIFNLLPIYPLDGFRIIEALFDRNNRFYLFIKNYSRYILFGLIILSVIGSTINYNYDLLGVGMDFLRTWVGKPIELFWGLFF